MAKHTTEAYWASAPVNEIADEILDKVDKYYQYLAVSGRLYLYRRSWAYYYKPKVSGSQMNMTGEQGELTTMTINQYRNLLVHLETMTTQQKAVFEPQASNSDVKSKAQTILAKALLDYYARDKGLNYNFVAAVKDGLLYGDGYLRVEWDVTGGKEYGLTETGATRFEGDIKYTNYSPFDVIRDVTKLKPNEDSYFILRDFVNKHDLAAKYPDIEKDILDDSIDQLALARTTTLSWMVLEESDNIPVYTLLHKPTPSMPQGRYTQILDNGTVLNDGPLPYKTPHVYRISPDQESGTIFGYTVAFDLLPIQEALDMLYSTALTNNATFGVQNILIPKGHDISTSAVSGGLNLMEYDPRIGKPEALQLTATAPETYNFMNMLNTIAETISGVNSTARGNPDANLKSGAALALVQSMAIQFNQNLQRSYAKLIEDVGTGTIHVLRDFASVPRVAAIVGKSNRPLMKEFTGEDLSGINRVQVDMGNPMTSTIAGKTNLAEWMLNYNMIDNPDQIIEVITTGRMEPVIQAKQDQGLLMKAENEGLAEGIPQRALATDWHDKHIAEHATVLSNPDLRSDPNNPIIQVTLNHIQEHLELLKTTDPVLLSIGKQQSTAGQPPMENAAGDMMNAAPPVVQQAGEVNQPNMPSPPVGTDAVSADVIAQQQTLTP